MRHSQISWPLDSQIAMVSWFPNFHGSMIPRLSWPHDSPFRNGQFPPSQFLTLPWKEVIYVINQLRWFISCFLLALPNYFGSYSLQGTKVLPSCSVGCISYKSTGLRALFFFFFFPGDSEEESSSIPLQLPRATGFVGLTASPPIFTTSKRRQAFTLLSLWFSALKDIHCPLAWVHLYNPGWPNHFGIFNLNYLHSHSYDAVWPIHRLHSLGRGHLWGPFFCLLQKDNIKFTNLIFFT